VWRTSWQGHVEILCIAIIRDEIYNILVGRGFFGRRHIFCSAVGVNPGWHGQDTILKEHTNLFNRGEERKESTAYKGRTQRKQVNSFKNKVKNKVKKGIEHWKKQKIFEKKK